MASPSINYQPAPTMAVIYDSDTLSLRVWDGVLEAGSIVIGAVTQSGTWTFTPSGTQAVSSTTLATAAAQASILAEILRASTPAFSTVSVLTSSTAILGSNAARLGATIYNESGAIAYVKLGATASLTSYTVQIPILGYYEAPYGYTGAIAGITVAITAVCRVTEFT